MKPLHQRLNLYYDDDQAYIFVPSGESVSAQSLSINRATGDIFLNPPHNTLPQTARRSGNIVYGILGVISLTLSEYVVIITGREHRGRLMGHDIYRASDFEILPLNPNVNVLHVQHPVEAHLLALLKSHLDTGVFLFSYGWDMTRRLQAQWENLSSDMEKGFWEAADDRFFWNKHLQTRFIESSVKQDLSAYILPVIYGTFDIRPVLLHGRHMQLCLISRRSRYRAGTRYFRRGIDEKGHVANFNESEQILLVEPLGTSRADDFAHKLSFVQIRGSVPLYWAEINTLRYKPDLQIMEKENATEATKKHLLAQVATYGTQTLVSLVNHKGHEKPVKESYEDYVAKLYLPEVRYQYFDFHTECKNMRWDRISILVDLLKDDIKEKGYFHVHADEPQPLRVQKGTVRTNCMDNLDRTNVVQATLAKYTLNVQLQELGILTKEQGVDDYEVLSRDFREMWADHADLISKAYAGSGALKSDFTRTNKRTRKGLLEDGVKSVLRYLKNNYFDGARQDGFDLFTGNWTPSSNPSAAMSLVTDSRPLILRAMPAVTSFSFFMICAGLTLPRTSDYSLSYYFLLWIVLFLISLEVIVLHGIDFVAWPRLVPLTETVYYNGPGYRSARHGMGVKMPYIGSTALWFRNRRQKQRTKSTSIEKGDIPMSVVGNKKRVD